MPTNTTGTEPGIDPQSDADIDTNKSMYNLMSDGAKYSAEQDSSEDSDIEDGDDNRAKKRGRIWLKLDFSLGLLVKIAILGGSVFAGFQYMSAKSDARTAMTFEYISAYESGPLLAAREKVRRQFREYEGVFEKNLLPPEDFDRLILSFTSGDAGEPLEDELDRIIDFYKGLTLCIEQELCDSELASVFFDPEAHYYWDNFQPYIDYRAKRNNSCFGKALKEFATELPVECED